MSAPSPIWLLSAPFSGNAWAAGCLHQHPQLFALPQLDMLLADTVGDALKVFELSQGTHGHGLRRTIAWLLFEGNDNRAIGQADSWLARHAQWSCGQLIDYLAELVAPCRLIIPDDDAALRPIAWRRLRTISSTPVMVHLTRHPWSQGTLLHQWSCEHVFVPLDYRDHSFIPPQTEPQLPWFAANNNLLNWRKQLSPEQSLLLHSEDIESDDAGVWSRLCEWLKIEHSGAIEQAMCTPASWPFAQPGPSLAPAGLDAEGHAKFSRATLKQAEQTRLDGPLPWRADGQAFAPEVRALAQQLGYAQRA